MKGTAFGQNLESVPVGRFHCVKYGINERPGYLFMEEVAHRIHENTPRLSPTKRLCQPLWTQF